MKRKAPAMQLYVKDAVTDTGHLPPEAFKGLWMLTFKAWAGVEGQEQGYLPGDDERLQELSGLDPRAWRRVGQRVLGLLGHAEDGRYYSKRGLEEIQKLREVSDKRADAGRAGAGARWQKPSQWNGNRTDLPMANDSSASASALASSSPPPTRPPSGEGARANGLGQYPSAEAAEAAFEVFLSKYPAEGVPSAVKAQHAWAEALPVLPPLHDLLAALERHKRSDQWQRNKVHSIVRWLGDRMWTGKLGEASTEAGRYRVLGE